MMQYFYRNKSEEQLCKIFEGIVFDYPQIKFFQPNKEKAPWHVQALIDGDETELMDFWPHKMKGHRENGLSVEGEDEVRAIIDAALDEALDPAFDVFEAAE